MDLSEPLTLFVIMVCPVIVVRQCTECDSSSSEEEDAKVDGNDNSTLLERRQKRNIKEPTKFTPGRDVSFKKLMKLN